jgi:hypothetical protein
LSSPIPPGHTSSNQPSKIGQEEIDPGHTSSYQAPKIGQEKIETGHTSSYEGPKIGQERTEPRERGGHLDNSQEFKMTNQQVRTSHLTTF